VLRAFANREFGLGPADWGHDDVWRDWYEADERVRRAWYAAILNGDGR
jgi:hypothetical protein